MGTTTETRITSTQAKDAIYKAHSMPSASDVITVTENITSLPYVYGNSSTFDTMTLSVGDLKSTEYSNPDFHNISESQLVSTTIKAAADGIATIKAYSIDGANNIVLLHSYPPISVTSGTHVYMITDEYLLPQGCFLAVLAPTINYSSTGSDYTGYRIVADTNIALATKTKIAVSFNTVFNKAFKQRAVTLTYAKSLFPLVNNTAYSSSFRKVKIETSDKIKLYGDSISSTDYLWYKSELENLTSATVDRGGYSGANAASLCQSFALNTIYSYNPNVIICLIGANDTGASGTVGTFGMTNEPLVSEVDPTTTYTGTHFIQALSYIMQNIKNKYYDIRTRANLTGSESETEKEAKIDATLKPLIVFCTPLPQQRISLANPYSTEENWERKRLAVIECCLKYKVACVDLYKELDIDIRKEPFYTSPTDKVNNKGLYFMDGLHPNKYGYRRIAEIITSNIKL